MDQNTLRDRICEYVKSQYNAESERLWRRYPNYVIFRHEDNRKWFGGILDVQRSRLGLEGDGSVDVLNVKSGRTKRRL